MARKTKKGLDYFPHSCQYDDELKYIIAVHGSDGYMIYFELLRKIYSSNGYYMSSDKKVLALFASEINVDIEKINAVINDCLSEDLFSKRLHEEYNILTSASIQDRYFEAIKRRREVDLVTNYILLENVNIYLENVNINSLNVNKSTQSRVEESKVKKSKVNNTVKKNNLTEARNVLNEVYKYFDIEVIKGLTNKQKDEWVDTIDKLNRIDGYKFSDIKNVIIWARQNDFWAKNCLAIPPLRKKKHGVSKFFQIIKAIQHEESKQSKDTITQEKAWGISKQLKKSLDEVRKKNG